MDERLIVFGYRDLSLGLSRRFVENNTREPLVAEKVFYGKPKPIRDSENEVFLLQPNECVIITEEPAYGIPGRTIRDRHYGVAHKYGRFQWFFH